MYLLYSLALSVGFALLLPYFAYQVLRYGKHKESLKERLGRLPGTLESDKPTIWIHAVSVGEFLAAKPLIEALRAEFPAHRFLVSNTTQTGQTLARATVSSQTNGAVSRSQPSSEKLIDGAFY